MIRFLKTGISAEQDAADIAKVRQTVEAILADIEKRGDEAVREYSRKFDNWDPPAFELSAAQIQACVKAMSPRDVDDIRFAQAQIRNFAQIQKEALRDVEVETLPGRDPGPPEHPGEQRRLLRAGRQVSAARFGAHDHPHREGRRREAGHRLRAAVPGQAGAGHRHRHASGRRGRDLLPGRRAGDRRDGDRHGLDHGLRHGGRPGQRLRGRGQAAAGRPRRASICSPGPRRRWSSPTTAATRRCAPPICSGRPSTARPRRRSC